MEDLAKMLEQTPGTLKLDGKDAAWVKMEQERLASQQKKMENIFGRDEGVARVGLNDGKAGVTTSGMIQAIAQAKQQHEQKARNKVSLNEKKRLMKAKRTMGREEYNKVAKDYTEKSNKRQADQTGGVYVGDPACEHGESTFNHLLQELKQNVARGQISASQGDSLTRALGSAENMMGKMSKAQRAMFHSMISAQGLSQFVGAPKSRQVTPLDLQAAPPAAKNVEKRQEDDDKTARQRKNRKKREKYREKKRALLMKKQQEECPPPKS